MDERAPTRGTSRLQCPRATAQPLMGASVSILLPSLPPGRPLKFIHSPGVPGRRRGPSRSSCRCARSLSTPPTWTQEGGAGRGGAGRGGGGRGGPGRSGAGQGSGYNIGEEGACWAHVQCTMARSSNLGRPASEQPAPAGPKHTHGCIGAERCREAAGWAGQGCALERKRYLDRCDPGGNGREKKKQKGKKDTIQ